jgi:hypothetical protein
MTAPPADARVLVVANRTASTPMLLAEVARRAREGASFTLLVPPERDADRDLDWTREDALDLLRRSADGEVAWLDCGADALQTIHGAVDAGGFDAIIVSTVPEHLGRWLHHDLPHRIEHLGLPIVVVPPEPDAPLDDDLARGMPSGWDYPPGVGGAEGAL